MGVFSYNLCLINIRMSTAAQCMRSMHRTKDTDYSVTLTSSQLDVYLEDVGVLAVICPGSLCPGNILLLTQSLKEPTD